MHVTIVDEPKEPLPGKKDYRLLVKNGLKVVEKYVTSDQFFSNSEIFSSSMRAVFDGLQSADEMNWSGDYIKLYHFHNQIISRPYINDIINGEALPCSKHNQICYVYSNLRATLIQYYLGYCTKLDLHNAVVQLELWASIVKINDEFDDQVREYIRLSREALKGLSPYYIIKFKFAFSLPIPDGEYEVNTQNLQTFTVKSFSDSTVVSKVGDRFFSEISLKMTGYTVTDRHWCGPSIDGQTEVHTDFCLSFINELILKIKIAEPTVRIAELAEDDLGNVSIEQYTHNNERLNSTLHFSMGSLSVANILSKQVLNPEQIDNVLTSESLRLFEKLHGQACIARDRGEDVKAFYILNSALESAIAHYLDKLANASQKMPELTEFLEGRSKCLDCELFTASELQEPPHRNMVPSISAQIKFLSNISTVTGAQRKRLNSCIYKVKGQDVRNDLVHGKIATVPKDNLHQAFEAYVSCVDILSVLTPLKNN
ncbi:hypothetical protein [Vibrio hepatarius]|uniref:hypothetical protein n=1 Tax=Vibrio hepatarius TaxID=171383 RepID=UPI003735AE07